MGNLLERGTAPYPLEVEEEEKEKEKGKEAERAADHPVSGSTME